MPRESDNGFEEWGGYMGAKITKLEEQFAAASDPFRQSNLFAGISIFVNGLTNPSADELKRIMMVHGGTFHHYERAHTTYIIASNLPDVKVRNMNTSKIIRARWVVECLREKRILDYTRYLLYTNQKTSQPRLMFKNAKKEEPQREKVAAIMRGLDELNEKIRQDLASTSGKAGQIEVKADIEAPIAGNLSLEGENKFQKKSSVALSTVASEPNHLNISAGGSVARTAIDPKFLSEFYNNSRLHHIATLGTGFKQYISDLRDNHDGAAGFPARARLLTEMTANNIQQLAKALDKSEPCVMHIDMDCFFVSVGLRQHPELRGLPVAVTHSKGGAVASKVPVHPSADRQAEKKLLAERFKHQHNDILVDKVRGGFDAKMSLSEIASASYEARAKGVRNGMFVGQALKLCPDLRTLPYDFEGYREVAFTLYDTVAQYTLNIEAVSCDELFVDLTEVLTELRVPSMDFVSAIRGEVRLKTGCPCSAGIGANKLQARMATKRAKPDGQYCLTDSNVQSYMTTIPIGELPGVGSSTRHTLEQAQASTCGDLQHMSLARLQALVGKKFGETLHKFCRGIDNRPLVFEQVRKSVSAEVNYGIRFTEHSEVDTFLRQLCKEVHSRLTEIRRKTKCITLKLMVRAKDAPLEASKFMGHGVCDNVTKSMSLAEHTNELAPITRSVLSTMNGLAVPPNELRGIGIQLSKLDEPVMSVASAVSTKEKPNRIKHLFSKAAAAKRTGIEQKDGDEDHPTGGNSILPRQSTSLNTNDGSTAESTATGMKRHCDREDEKRAEPVKKRKCSDSLVNLRSESNGKIEAEGKPLHRFLITPPSSNNVICIRRIDSNSDLCEPLTASDFLPSTSRQGEQRRIYKELINQMKDHLYNKLNNSVEVVAASNTSLNVENPSAPRQTVSDINVENIFAQNDCMALLLGWVRDCPSPEHYDTVLISNHGREFVRAGSLEQLYDPLLFLCRLLKFKTNRGDNCAWHKAYKFIIDAIHEEMGTVYKGRQLYFGGPFNCLNCK